MVDQLAQEYASRPVIFLEEDVDYPVSKDRYARWWAAPGPGGTVYLPLVMVDSGHLTSSGPVDYTIVYKSIVDAEMARAPGAEIECTSTHIGDRLRFSGRLTNRSGIPLSHSENEASINALVYEDIRIGNTGRYVRAAVSSAITGSLSDGTSTDFTLETPILSGVDWNKLHSIVFAEVRPGGSVGAYDMLQSVIPSTASPVDTLLFSHVAAGGGWSTYITLANTGATAAEGDLTFVGRDGLPLPIVLIELGVVARRRLGVGSLQANASSVPISIPSGATQIFTTSPESPEGLTWSGWAKVQSTGGSISGVSTFQYAPKGTLHTIAGVLGTTPTAAATIPVDMSIDEDRYMGFAIANPGNDDVNITLRTLNEDGTVADTITPGELNPLAPQHQVARFLHELLSSSSRFKGSLVLTAQEGQKFAVVALVQNRTILTAIPVVLSKTPRLP